MAKEKRVHYILFTCSLLAYPLADLNNLYTVNTPLWAYRTVHTNHLISYMHCALCREYSLSLHISYIAILPDPTHYHNSCIYLLYDICKHDHFSIHYTWHYTHYNNIPSYPSLYHSLHISHTIYVHRVQSQ
jgi:hypothetical protein